MSHTGSSARTEWPRSGRLRSRQMHVRDLIDLEAEAMMRTGRTEDFTRATQAFLN